MPSFSCYTQTYGYVAPGLTVTAATVALVTPG